MQSKEKRKLEILLELRKYISDEFIVGDINEIYADTIVYIKKNNNISKIIISVTKNCIFLDKKLFLSDLSNLSILCPNFKLISQKYFDESIIFLNQYINYFSIEKLFDANNIFNGDSYIEIFNNDFYTHLTSSEKIIFTERKINYKNTVSLYNKKGYKQDIIINSNGNGNLNISIDFENQNIKHPYCELKEEDYFKYFWMSHNKLFDKLNDECKVYENKKFDDIKKCLFLIDMLDF